MNGVNRTPCLDPATGEVLDFVHVPEEVRHGVWTRGVARLNGEPYAAAALADSGCDRRSRLRRDLRPLASGDGRLRRRRHPHAGASHR